MTPPVRAQLVIEYAREMIQKKKKEIYFSFLFFLIKLFLFFPKEKKKFGRRI
jgi:hypothetical protein